MMVAGEASGDAQAAKLAAAMLALEPGLSLYGVGGPAMRGAGVSTLFDSADLSIMGFTETLGRLASVRRCYRELKKGLVGTEPPDLLVLVDFPDFNLPLARIARRAGVKVLYYVAPQVWAWRRGRIAKLARRVDRMIVVFPFEADLYRAHGIDAHFVGNPLAEDVGPSGGGAEMLRRHGLDSGGPLVALLPGSRAKEIRAVLPVMLEAAAMMKERARFAIAAAPGLDRELLERAVGQSGLEVPIIEGATYDLVAASQAVAVTSGTATVECALLGTPMVVAYRMSALSYLVARSLVSVPYMAMPNIILDEAAVPELLQGELTAARLRDELETYLDGGSTADRVRSKLGALRDRLVRPGAANAAARLALEVLG